MTAWKGESGLRPASPSPLSSGQSQPPSLILSSPMPSTPSLSALSTSFYSQFHGSLSLFALFPLLSSPSSIPSSLPRHVSSLLRELSRISFFLPCTSAPSVHFTSLSHFAYCSAFIYLLSPCTHPFLPSLPYPPFSFHRLVFLSFPSSPLISSHFTDCPILPPASRTFSLLLSLTCSSSNKQLHYSAWEHDRKCV